VTSTARERRLPAAALSAASRASDPASDASCRAPRLPLLQGIHREPGSLPLPSRQRGQLSRTEAPSISKCTASAAREKRARHRTQGFAAMGRLPTLFHPSLCSRTEELDPRRWAWAVHPGSRGPHAACRLLQSKRIASTTARPSKPRTPHRSRLLHSAFCGWLEPVSGPASRDFMGQGSRWLPTHDLSPSRSLAMKSFTPTRSARAPPVANLLPPEAGVASTEDVP
jgi:hypothetical protein